MFAATPGAAPDVAACSGTMHAKHAAPEHHVHQHQPPCDAMSALCMHACSRPAIDAPQTSSHADCATQPPVGGADEGPSRTVQSCRASGRSCRAPWGSTRRPRRPRPAPEQHPCCRSAPTRRCAAALKRRQRLWGPAPAPALGAPACARAAAHAGWTWPARQGQA